MNTKPLAAIVRSSDGVAERQQNGTYHADTDQVADIERYATGLRNQPLVVFMEPELDVSGGLPIDGRPSLREAIEGVERGVYGGIVVAYLSRLTRSRSGIEIWDRVERAGGHVHCALENLDTSTPNGRFVRDIHLANAVREREEHVDRFAIRRRKTVDAGIWRQRQLPRGYVFAGPANSDGKFKGVARRLKVEPVGAEQVRGAARDVLAAVPVVRIAEQLKMTPAGVRAMLRNRIYLGELWDGGHTKRDERGHVVLTHEPILDETTFDAVGVALKSTPRPARRVEDGPALLARIVRCAGCGRVMTRRATARVLYSCVVHHSGGRCEAPASITAARLDEYVERLAQERYATVRVRGDAVSDVGAAEKRLADVRAGIARVVRTLAAAGLSESDAADELSGLRAELREAEGGLRTARARSVAPLVIPGDEAYRRLDATGRNAALRGLVARVVVERSGRGGRPDVAGRVQVAFRDD
jgi:DNA invertase Pin-like site-specific DNA recombinase